MANVKTRLFKEQVAKTLMRLSGMAVTGSLFFILGTILYKGLPYISWDMITQVPKGGFYIGKEGGILNAILGSLYLAGAATLLSTLIGIPIAIYLNIYVRSGSKLAQLSKLLFDVLFGIPSIVYGAVAFSLMVWLGIRASLLGGIITITLLTIPIVVRTVDELIKTIPGDLKHVTLSLGTTRWEVAKIFIRYIRPGILTAILLAFGRSIGDVAGVLLTTGFSDNLPKYIDEPAATLPLAIFFQLSSPIPEVQGRAYASALILSLIILIIVLCTHILQSKQKKHKI
ncbi:PstA family ABC transporter permease [Sphingobacterium spiritivorum]|uniref:Phosphate ABC transporter, permease protein PstA n=2 Tax=Sphingobacterium spiritivorum TaxID=258 RepID=D7VRW4_SPHSI|nr:ABC transporter permease subunit [Sphingobacterium spiritivorum]EFK56515.1 putative phosphate ABC transporter, permease protein PstA [Sphingobacterium spiritivorum ATCC 33861]QQS95759.1 ABC transporter permease subunit [Sphingobacterium spiritivorum]QQT35420.1 ABC transporter permease subunit [Sphingobacterium spiritivorum]WQD32107.1 ABC transporter permease subunit [Sphingobacterium spiritivorum]SUJ05830.1 Phosphate transport system permease protein pstA [Sphingobacterium spiritivorum]